MEHVNIHETVKKLLDDNIKDAVLKLMLKNRRQAGEYQYTLPSTETYPYQWLWDSCFHAIILNHFSADDAQKEILSFLSKQFDNGLIPHMIYWEKADVFNINWGTEGTSSITQPPMVAYAVWRIFQKNGDEKFLRKVYPNLFHFYKYLINERDPHEQNLVGIITPDESGEDNSPRFDEPLGLPPIHSRKTNFKRRLKLIDENRKCNFDAPFCMKNFFWVKDVPFNAIMVENLKCLAHIAERLGHDYDAEYFGKQRQEIIDAMRELMFEDGIFWTTYGEDYKKIKVKTWALFAPLFAKIPTQEEAELLVNTYLLNKEEFWTEYPLPTVSLGEPSFNAEGYWRGPTWFAPNWFIYKGLIQYGFMDIASKLKNSSLKLLKKSGFREQFNPQTGKGLGAKEFTWGGLIIDMNDT
ncbi:MAG: hypothetical protein KJI72_01350 [Patescibacteria group bacterium]|nr:hypothetical protein [Patescibacteria group bacterium]